MSSSVQGPEVKALPAALAAPKPRAIAKTSALHEEAVQLIPGGASSTMRWASYEPYPVYMKSGRGSRIVDVDNNPYIDYLLAFGALINGHSHPRVVEAVRRQAAEGMMLGTAIELEIELAKTFKQFVPSAEMVAFANGGTDATSNAVRIARAATGKDIILKFEGHYHGQHDYALVSVEAPPVVAGMEEYPRSLPYSAGIPSLVLDTVIVSPWNNAKALERIMKRHRNDVAAIIMEPVMANSTVIPPNADYLKAVKEIAASNDALLIFDEVITGFRVAPGGAQQLYGVTADLSTWGKALGGGLPLAAVSGKKEYMELIGPGKVSYGGTYFANSLTLAGARANLEVLAEHDYQALKVLRERTDRLTSDLSEVVQRTKQRACIQSVPGIFTMCFSKYQKITNYRESLLIDWEKFRMLHQLLLDEGIYLHPDNYERVALSTVHSDEDITLTVQAFERALSRLA
ncbi:MAG TPA: aspartate aminotransferase family protein [Nitrososphaerales archaeon]|nr:aspartate aminotransferase family protein [Nitrososphaerales archaeon]